MLEQNRRGQTFWLTPLSPPTSSLCLSPLFSPCLLFSPCIWLVNRPPFSPPPPPSPQVEAERSGFSSSQAVLLEGKGGSCVYSPGPGVHLAESIIHIAQYQSEISSHLSRWQARPLLWRFPFGANYTRLDELSFYERCCSAWASSHRARDHQGPGEIFLVNGQMFGRMSIWGGGVGGWGWFLPRAHGFCQAEILPTLRQRSAMVFPSCSLVVVCLSRPSPGPDLRFERQQEQRLPSELVFWEMQLPDESAGKLSPSFDSVWTFLINGEVR